MLSDWIVLFVEVLCLVSAHWDTKTSKQDGTERKILLVQSFFVLAEKKIIKSVHKYPFVKFQIVS